MKLLYQRVKVKQSIAIILLLAKSVILYAAPVPLSDEPVLETASVAPNIMVQLDNSIAMQGSKLTTLQTAMINLVNSLQDVRMGLAVFSGLSGAQILVSVNDINNNQSRLNQAIASITATNMGAPLAEVIQGIGRYFVQDHNSILVLHPNQNNQLSKSAYTVFNLQPSYAFGVNRTSPIQQYCQKNFLITVTTNLPTNPAQVPPVGTGLETYSNNYAIAAASAMYDIDLRPDLTAPTGVIKKNNVVTYPIGFANAALKDNALMQQIADGGGGQYFYADNATQLTDALNLATAAILGQISTAGSVLFSNGVVGQDAAIYISEFNTRHWSGNVIRKALDALGNVTTITWEAATLLDQTLPGNREILTYNEDTKLGIPFQSWNELSTLQKNDLSKGGGSSLGQTRLNFIRGDRSLEGKGFRVRASVLGDIVNSSIVYVGEPNSNWPDNAPFPTSTSTKYSAFKKAKANRTPMLYVGANDGMLHALTASNGTEALAYIPSSVFSDADNAGLHYLTDPDYEHRFYVDLTPTVTDAYVKTTASGATAWHTILVGGERNGGSGYFALDVTNPSEFTDGNSNNLVMWEFSSRNDDRLGKTYSQPVIGLMNNGRWAAIFGNGYNASGTRTAELFIVYLDGGLNGQWQEGTDYVVIDTGSGSSSDPNGLASPGAVDLDGNGTIDRIYAGDLEGDVWAFDVSSSNAASWKVAYNQGKNPQPLYSGLSTQPITVRPAIVKNPAVNGTTNNQPNTLVMFGTGALLSSSDKLNTATQSFYGIWDAGTSNIKRSKLQKQSFTQANGKRILSDNTVSYTAKLSEKVEYGWYIDFSGGERIVSNPSVRSGIVFFNTVIPNISDPCSFSGSGWLMAASVENGGEPPVVVFDVNNDDELDANDQYMGKYVSGLQYANGAPAISTFKADTMYTPMENGTIDKRQVLSSPVKQGRIAWNILGGG